MIERRYGLPRKVKLVSDLISNTMCYATHLPSAAGAIMGEVSRARITLIGGPEAAEGVARAPVDLQLLRAAVDLLFAAGLVADEGRIASTAELESAVRCVRHVPLIDYSTGAIDDLCDTAAAQSSSGSGVSSGLGARGGGGGGGSAATAGSSPLVAGQARSSLVFSPTGATAGSAKGAGGRAIASYSPRTPSPYFEFLHSDLYSCAHRDFSAYADCFLQRE